MEEEFTTGQKVVVLEFSKNNPSDDRMTKRRRHLIGAELTIKRIDKNYRGEKLYIFNEIMPGLSETQGITGDFLRRVCDIDVSNIDLSGVDTLVTF